MIIPKWNYMEHKYDDHIIPNDWNCKTYSDDLNEIINCAQCGSQLKIGDSYCSVELHVPVSGFGYCVCERCHNKELETRKKFLRDDKKEVEL